jgi:hypothetical protein
VISAWSALTLSSLLSCLPLIHSKCRDKFSQTSILSSIASLHILVSPSR